MVGTNEPTEVLVEQAVENELPISFVYWSDDARFEWEVEGVPPKRRTVSPYELRDGRDGKTLLICWSHGSDGIRAFETGRIDRVQSEVGEEEFVPPVERS